MRNYAPSFRNNYATMAVLFWFLCFLPKPILLSWLTLFLSHSRHVPGLLLRCSSPTRSSQQQLQKELEVGRERGKKGKEKARAFLCSVLFTQVNLWCNVNCTLLGDFFHYVPLNSAPLQHFFLLYILGSPYAEEILFAGITWAVTYTIRNVFFSLLGPL